MRESKCEMARRRYCRKSSMGCCNLDDDKLDKCPYLNAIGEIAKLSVENMKFEDNQDKLKEWIAAYKERLSSSTDSLTLQDVIDALEEFVVE